jgi:potassium/hydrogen antiporter
MEFHGIAKISADSLLIIVGIIAIIGVISSWISEKINIPDVVLFLLSGILVGPAFINLVSLEGYPIINDLILTFGSAFILYEGGREVKLRVLNNVKITVSILSTIGVVVTSTLIAFAAYYIFNIDFIFGLLLGAVISSTDPASLIPVFNQAHIENKLKQTVVSESAFNDAAGAILVGSVLTAITTGRISLNTSFIELLTMIIVGTLIGVVSALVGIGLTSDKRYGILHNYSPIISVLICILSYEAASMLGGSGYMAVFVAGLVTGNKKTFGLWIPEQAYISGLHFRENVATLSRMAIFIVLGTQIDLDVLNKYWLPSLIIVLVLMFIIRPIVILISTFPDRKAMWSKNEIIFMMWVRETGVIPAALSSIIVSMGLPNNDIISSVVFMTILVTILVQASTTKWLAEKLNLREKI